VSQLRSGGLIEGVMLSWQSIIRLLLFKRNYQFNSLLGVPNTRLHRKIRFEQKQLGSTDNPSHQPNLCG
jgi:hypothetical protein